MHIIIAGESKLSYFLTKNFSSKGYRVSIIMPDAKEAEYLARNTKAEVIIGDATDPENLRNADAYYCDLLVAVTPRDEDNLIISLLASHEFGISKTLALANDPDNVSIFEKIGCKAFSPTHLVTQIIEQSVQIADIMSMSPAEKGKILFTEFKINASCPIINIPLKDIARPEQTLLVSITREDKVIIPNGDSTIQVGDSVIVLSVPQSHAAVVRMISGT